MYYQRLTNPKNKQTVKSLNVNCVSATMIRAHSVKHGDKLRSSYYEFPA